MKSEIEAKMNLMIHKQNLRLVARKMRTLDYKGATICGMKI